MFENKELIDWFNFIAFFAGPDPPEWRNYASLAYYKGKLYFLVGADVRSNANTNRVNVK